MKSFKTLFESQQLTIKDTEAGILYYKLIGFVNMELMQVLDKELIEAIRKTGAKKIITDTREMKVVATDAQKYSSENINPTWERLGVKFNAIIMPSNVFGKWTAKALTEKHEIRTQNSKTGFLINFFETEPDAINWLTEKI
jgi:hypothetical protein